jgi:hypothetical protein
LLLASAVSNRALFLNRFCLSLIDCADSLGVMAFVISGMESAVSGLMIFMKRRISCGTCELREVIGGMRVDVSDESMERFLASTELCSKLPSRMTKTSSTCWWKLTLPAENSAEFLRVALA